MANYEKIKVETADGVCVLTLNDPTTLNAASLQLAEELYDAIHHLTLGVIDARAVIITGEGRGFCSGANLSGGGPANARGAPDGKPDAGRGLETVYNPLVTAIRDLPMPVVTAVNGAAAGVGCSLALMGDLIVAGESAYFLQAFRRIGLVPDGGSTYILPRMIGRARAMEMTLLGEKIPAKQALDWGMINRCVPDAELMPTARALAEELARGPKSLGMIRKIMWESLDQHWTSALHNERMTQRHAGKTEDFVEGVQAFLQKRVAQFKGK